MLYDTDRKGGKLMLGLVSALTAAEIGSAIMNGICGIGTAVSVASFIRDILDD